MFEGSTPLVKSSFNTVPAPVTFAVINPVRFEQPEI
jgi:hypothetical protein